jgi:hypothetical protein
VGVDDVVARVVGREQQLDRDRCPGAECADRSTVPVSQPVWPQVTSSMGSGKPQSPMGVNAAVFTVTFANVTVPFGVVMSALKASLKMLPTNSGNSSVTKLKSTFRFRAGRHLEALLQGGADVRNRPGAVLKSSMHCPRSGRS